MRAIKCAGIGENGHPHSRVGHLPRVGHLRWPTDPNHKPLESSITTEGIKARVYS